MYAKLFASIYQGTLRGNTHGLVVFTNMLAHADKDGWVDMHPRAIAEEVGLTVEQVQEAINELESPDPESRSPEENGRRIVRMDEHRAWGWIVVNHAKYRAIRSEEDRREQNRIAQERWRNKNKPSVSTISQASAESANTETETDTKKPFVSHEKIVFDGTSFKNINGQLEVWKTAYPAIDVTSELNKIAAWVVANPKNVKKQWGRFINGWLSRAQDKAPKVGRDEGEIL